jgi:hypothetical protein
MLHQNGFIAVVAVGQIEKSHLAKCSRYAMPAVKFRPLRETLTHVAAPSHSGMMYCGARTDYCIITQRILLWPTTLI